MYNRGTLIKKVTNDYLAIPIITITDRSKGTRNNNKTKINETIGFS